MTILSAAALLFLVMDPFGNIPFFVSALKNVDEKRRNKVVVRELLIALLALIIFLFSGSRLLSLLQISESALTASGGIVLFLIAVKMIFPVDGGRSEEAVSGEPFIVPLAIPYIAGPSALASVLLIMNRDPSRWDEWLIALVLAWFVSGIIISSAGLFARVLGEKGLIAIERLMGMVLVAIAVQMLMTGITQFISGV